MRSSFWIAALVVAPMAASGQVRLPEMAEGRVIEVVGEASLRATPDFAQVSLGVTTAGKDAAQAMADNARAVNALIALVKAEGVAAADIQTSSLSVSPQFANPSQTSPRTPAIAGYVANNTVTVTARDFAKLGSLIDKAVGAGANAIYGIAYGENDPGALIDNIRPLAVADARRKAEIYAHAAGAKVGRLMALSEVGGAPPPMSFARRASVQNAGAAPTPIEAGEDKLTIAVTARFELTE
jgi:uncharacterized protein